MAVGMAGFIGVGVNSATGANSVAIVDFLPFISETIQAGRNDIADPSLGNTFYERKVYNGLQRVEGNVTVNIHPTLAGYLLRPLFDTYSVQQAWGITSHATVRAHRFTAANNLFHAGSGSDLPTITMEINRGPLINAGSSFMYYGLAGNTGEISIAAGEVAQLSLDVVGQGDGGKARSTPSYVPQDAFLWHTCSVSVNGSGKPDFERVSIRMENNLQQFPTLNNQSTFIDEIKRNDFARPRVTGQLGFKGYNDYNDFKSGSEMLLRMTFTGKAITTSHFEVMDITVPRFRYETFPINVGGPGRIAVGFTGRGVLDPTSNYALEVVLVNSRTSGYHVNTTA